MKNILLLGSLMFFSVMNIAEELNKSIRGRVTDQSTQQPLQGVNVIILDTNFGAATDINGEYKIENIPPGRYTLRASFIGYVTQVNSEVIISSAHSETVDFELRPSVLETQEVTVRADYFRKDANAANSVTSLNYEEIRRSPGGYEDVVRALSILPGIAQAEAGRNDLVVRGGAPSENLYLIDEVVVPNINHFGSQGATGGPLSYIDLNYVKDVSFSTGGFSSVYGDKLSSVMKIKLGEGRKDRLGGRATISATQFGINAEGPVGNSVSFLFSARRSYLDFIFKAAGFGFVPEYYDLLNKVTVSAGPQDQFSFLFIGAFDNVRYFNNTSDQRYSNSRTLGNDQIQYTGALSYRHLFSSGFYNISLNRNSVDYELFQRDSLLNPIFVNSSFERENIFKADLVFRPSSTSEISAGLLYRLIEFDAEVKLPFFSTRFGDTLSVNSLKQSSLFNKLGTYLQFSDKLNSHFSFTAGLRLDYFDGIKDPVTISPRLSFSYFPDAISSLNFSTGIYHQNPSYIWLIGDNRNRDLKSIRSTHFILGYERSLREDTRLRLEGFYKIYSNYPVSTLRPYLILANTGAGFGGSEDNFSSFALEHLISRGKGDVKGIELQIQKKSSKIPYYGILSLTYNKSLFAALDGITRPGSYDQEFILNVSGGYIFSNEWEAAFKFRLSTGKPYTPFNDNGTQSVHKYNSARLEPLHSLDLRVDRRWNFESWGLVTYIDIQNIYNRKNISQQSWDDRKGGIRDASGIGILPSIGVSAEF